MINARERTHAYREQGLAIEQGFDEPGKEYPRHKHERTVLYTISGSLLLNREVLAGLSVITMLAGTAGCGHGERTQIIKAETVRLQSLAHEVIAFSATAPHRITSTNEDNIAGFSVAATGGVMLFKVMQLEPVSQPGQLVELTIEQRLDDVPSLELDISLLGDSRLKAACTELPSDNQLRNATSTDHSRRIHYSYDTTVVNHDLNTAHELVQSAESYAALGNGLPMQPMTRCP